MRIHIPGVPSTEEQLVKLLLKAGIKIESDNSSVDRIYVRSRMELITQTALEILGNIYNMKHPENVHVYAAGKKMKEITDPKKKLKSILLWPKLADLGFEPNTLEALAASAIQMKTEMKKTDPHLHINLTDKEICDCLKVDPLKVEAIVFALEGKTFAARYG